METVLIQSGCGNTQARISLANGFNLFSLIVDEVELLWTDAQFVDGQASASGSGTPILFPFPGRLNGRTYSFEGKQYELDSDDGIGNAIHGFVLNRPWRVVNAGESFVTGEFQASVDDPVLLNQWPADFLIRCTYRAASDGVEAEYEVVNPDVSPLPCGLGTHAYFRLPVGEGEADDCMVTCPVSERWTLKDMLTTGEVGPLGVTENYSEGIRFGDLRLDDVFSGIEFNQGRATASIANPANDRTMVYTWDEACEVCVMYTPPHREAICMEPYTLVPGGLAFASGEHGLIVLQPGEAFTHQMEIRLR